MKKIFTLMAAMLLVPWVGWGQDSKPWNGKADISWYDKNKNEFVITTAEQLAGLTLKDATYDFDNKTIKLGANIILNADYSNYESWETNNTGLKEWSPIPLGSYENFTFDGCGFEVKGLYINSEDSGNKGLFSVAGDQGDTKSTNAVIKNLKVTHSFVKVDDVNSYIGGIVGALHTSWTISNCYFDGEIKVSNNLTYVGGICGLGRGKIESCGNAGNISVTLNSVSASVQGKSIGGICGSSLSNESIITNCFNTGKISVEGTSNNISMLEIGGIAGNAITYGCYNTGDVYAPISNTGTYCVTLIGGIAGNSKAIKYCYNKGTVTGTEANTETYIVKVGDIYGAYATTSFGTPTLEKNYILSTSESTDGITSATEEQFKSGEVAWNLRGPFTIDDETTILGFGQDLQDASITSPTLLAFTPGKEVYKLTLDYSGYNNEEQEEKFANSGFLNLPELVATETEKEVGWYDENGTLYTSTSAISDDITLYAKKQTLHNITIEATEGGSVSADKKQAIVGEKITLTVTPDEGYALESISATTEEGEPVDITDNTFIMPDANVTVSATFAKVKYTVTIGELTNGSITIGEEGKTEAVFVPGDPVSLNITPDEGYDIDQLFLNDVEITGTTFEMPAAYVVVTATFKLKPVEDDDEDTGAIKKRYRLYLADQDFYLNDEYDEAGLVLYSRHDKKYTDVGGSFTVWFEKNGEVNEGARVFISNRANGEYKEVKLDEVSGYYQIRNVQSNIYVKLYTKEGFPVANETIEATDARAYAQANKIVVITPEPTDVQIISMAGAVVATAQVAGQQEFANLTEGVYIVRMGESIVKLQVRN